jgi:hypothetical protein
MVRKKKVVKIETRHKKSETKQEGWKRESKGDKIRKCNADMTRERQRVAKRESEGGRKVGK